MFALGDLDALATPGLKAVLQELPAFPEVELATVKAPGRHGEFFAQATLGAATWTFDLQARAQDPWEALAITEQITRACNPLDGLRPLRIDIAPGFIWMAGVERTLKWARGRWVIGSDCRLNAVLDLRAPDPFGYAVPDETWAWPGLPPGGAVVTRYQGNTNSTPTITITGTLSAAHSVTVTLGDWSVQITGPLASGQRIVLDYPRMDFGVWAGDVKLASVVSRMAHYDPPSLPVGSYPVSMTTTGGAPALQIAANSRRT